jgi:hypothetical protein
MNHLGHPTCGIKYKWEVLKDVLNSPNLMHSNKQANENHIIRYNSVSGALLFLE